MYRAGVHPALWPSVRGFGPFPNRNQTADFFAVGALPVLACCADGLAGGEKGGGAGLAGGLAGGGDGGVRQFFAGGGGAAVRDDGGLPGPGDVAPDASPGVGRQAGALAARGDGPVAGAGAGQRVADLRRGDPGAAALRHGDERRQHDVQRPARGDLPGHAAHGGAFTLVRGRVGHVQRDLRDVSAVGRREPVARQASRERLAVAGGGTGLAGRAGGVGGAGTAGAADAAPEARARATAAAGGGGGRGGVRRAQLGGRFRAPGRERVRRVVSGGAGTARSACGGGAAGGGKRGGGSDPALAGVGFSRDGRGVSRRGVGVDPGGTRLVAAAR